MAASPFFIRFTAVAFCGTFWLAVASCSSHYAGADADRQEAFVSYRGCASCQSLAEVR